MVLLLNEIMKQCHQDLALHGTGLVMWPKWGEDKKAKEGIEKILKRAARDGYTPLVKVYLAPNERWVL